MEDKLKFSNLLSEIVILEFSKRNDPDFLNKLKKDMHNMKNKLEKIYKVKNTDLEKYIRFAEKVYTPSPSPGKSSPIIINKSRKRKRLPSPSESPNTKTRSKRRKISQTKESLSVNQSPNQKPITPPTTSPLPPIVDWNKNPPTMSLIPQKRRINK
jgi:hypothetical protein